MNKSVIDMHNIISSAEAIEIIETSVKTLMENPTLSHNIPPVMLRGAPGVGKSTIVKNIAKRLGIGFVDVRLAELERVDIAGLPSINNGTTKWNVPSFLPQDPDSKGILLLDELTAAPADVQVAAYQLILDRCISNSDYKLPDGWFIVAAGNRLQDRAVAKTMSSALANRLAHFEVEANVEDWREWAVPNDIHPSVVGYVGYRPQNLFKMDDQNLEQGWPSPRSWERVSHVIPLYRNNENVLRKVVFGLVGDAVGTEFMSFYKINEQFDDVLEMMTNPKKPIVIPEKADRRYALASAVSYLLWNGKNEADTEARVDGMYRIINDMPADFATMIVKSAILGNSKIDRTKACGYIIKAKAYKDFAKKFGKTFTKQYKLEV